MLADLSRSRAQLGFSPSETAIFIFSLKQPLFDRLRREFGNDAQGLADAVWSSTNLLDKLGLYTTEVHQKRREEVIARQQQELLELSTPVVELWDGILALPLIGTLDSARTQVVMESLLRAHRRDRGQDRDYRHHRRADRRHARRAAPAEDRRGRAADGRRLHHQRHPAADRADDRASRRRPQLGRHQGDARRCLPRRAVSASKLTVTAGREAVVAVMERIPILKIGSFLLVSIQVDMHDRLAMSLQDDLTAADRQDAGQGRAHRHLVARAGGLVHRPDARQHRRDVARPRRTDRASSACGLPSRSRSSSWECRCPACGRH